MATVHWFGAGMSNSGAALRSLADRADHVVLWGRDSGRLADRVEALGLTGAVDTALIGDGSAALAAGDVVVSMLPGAQHIELAEAALAAGAHFACSSYTSPELEEVGARAARRGLVVLTEAGLDPGIDHLMAHDLVHRAKDRLGENAHRVQFTSYCGGLAVDPGPFRYKFSWAPFGVLNALRSPATYLAGGEPTTVDRPWESTTSIDVLGEPFEAYPNRDSVPFIAQYQLPSGWELDSFVRGTLRSAGWREAWSEVFETVQFGSDDALRELATELAVRYPTSASDVDRVVLSVELTAFQDRVPGDTGAAWRGSYTLDAVGDEHGSAMARCVTEPLVHGVGRILNGALPPGLNRAVSAPGEVTAWLDHLASRGIDWTLQVDAS